MRLRGGYIPIIYITDFLSNIMIYIHIGFGQVSLKDMVNP